MQKFVDVDSYIASFPSSVQKMLEEVRSCIKACAPGAQERISYGMPAYVWHGNLVYFAGFKGHIGFYATPTGHEAFKEDLKRYKQGKGSVQFPLTEPMPLDLIKKIVLFRMQENEARDSKA